MVHSFEDTVIFAQGGLNWDDDLLMLPPADARYRENVIISDEENYSVFTNVLGNVLKNDAVGGGTFTYPSGTIRVIGSVENKEELANIFFIYSSAGNHSIVQYYSGTDDLEYILDGSAQSGDVGTLLNFQELTYIDAGIIGNEEDKYLVWTDGVNEPRIININLAITGGYTTITETIISFYKRPYLGSWSISYQDISDVVNKLRGSLWQFAVRLKYIDRTYSVLSPFSPIPIPEDDEYINGTVVDDIYNNRIQISIDDLEDENIAEYQLCFRKIDVESGVPSEWYLSDTPFTDSGATRVALFTGESGSSILASSYSSKIQDWVPDLADHLGIIDSNRVVLGDVTEGYDNLISIDVSLNSVNATIPSFYNYQDEVFDLGSDETLIVDFNSGQDRYYKLFVRLNDLTPYIKVYFYYNPATKNEVSSYFVDAINADFGGGTVSLDGSDDIVLPTTLSGRGGLYLQTTGPNIQVPVFKTNATHSFGIIYLYNGKYGYVQRDNNCVITIDADITGLWTSAKTIEASIDHLAPVGATHYQWAYLGSDVDYFEEYIIEIELDSQDRIVANSFVSIDGDYLKINKSNLINYNRDVYSDSIEYGFDYSLGDIIYFKGYFSFSGNLVAIAGSSIYAFTEILQTPILNVTSTEIIIQNVIEPQFKDTYGAAKYIVMQIYRRRDLLSGDSYQAIPGVYEIDQATRYHNGNSQNQTGAQPAIVNFENFGDCFFVKRIFANELISNYLYWHTLSPFTNGIDYWFWGNSEQKNFSLMYDSQLANFGKPNVYNEFAERKKFRKIRWGGKFLDNSGVNFMSSFDFDDERIVDDRNGDINRIQQIGDTLKVYQERKVNSLYLKTTSSTGADGSQTYVFSGEVMSDVRQSVMDYGCTHFSSYVKTVRNAYFFDLINATVLRDTPGGLIPVGDFKMKSYFRQKVRQIQAYGESNVEIYGGYDEYLDMYLLTFVVPGDPGNVIEETIGFYEPADRWISFYSYIPEYYGKISGDTAIAFKSGMLYLQNKNSIRNNFFISQDSSVVDVVSKGNPGLIKVWDSLDIIAQGEWSPDQDGDIEITLPIFMQSKLLSGYFELQEGIYHANFLRDQLDGGSSPTRYNLHNGRQLRGNEIRVRLRNDDVDEANLRMVNIKSSMSL